MLVAAAACTKRPVATDPVKLMWFIPLFAQRAAPAEAPSPGTTFKTPFGRPASIARLANAKAVKQASSAGFKTHVLPIARAAPTERPIICMG